MWLHFSLALLHFQFLPADEYFFFFFCRLLMRKALFQHLTARGIQVKLLSCPFNSHLHK